MATKYPQYKIGQWIDTSEEAMSKPELTISYGVEIRPHKGANAQVHGRPPSRATVGWGRTTIKGLKMNTTICVSYRDGMVCADGFVQKPFCRGQAGCHACGNISDKATPLCLRDELPSHMVTDGGNPLFYKAPNA